MNAQATVHGQLGDLDQAETLNLEARSRALAAGETRLAAMTALNLGVISHVRGDHEKTLRYYRMSLARIPLARRTEGSARDAQQHGQTVHGLERWDDASAAFDEAAQIADAIGDMPSRITARGESRRARDSRAAISSPRAPRASSRRRFSANAGRLRDRRDRQALRARSRVRCGELPRR